MAIRLECSKSLQKKIYVKPSKKDANLTGNLRVIKIADSSSINKKIIKKPWGYEHRIYINHSLEIWKLFLDPQASTSFHCHPHKDTLLLCIQGTLNFETTSGTRKLTPGECVFIERGALHRTSSNNTAILLEVESPPEKNDLIRIQDKYGRNRIGYEIKNSTYDKPIQKVALTIPRATKAIKGYQVKLNEFYAEKNCTLPISNLIIKDLDFNGKYLQISNLLKNKNWLLVLDGDLELKKGKSTTKLSSGSIGRINKNSLLLTHSSHLLIW